MNANLLKTRGGYTVEVKPTGDELTRALQASAPARSANHEQMLRHGAYNLLKVTDRKGPLRSEVRGYITLLPALVDKTPLQIEIVLGLRAGDLAEGARIYRLLRLPERDEFLPRGYTTLVDGLALPQGAKTDAAGYRPGHGAWQVTLLEPVPVTLIADLKPDQAFSPGLHPRIQAMYGR
jgi:preprotein translocase subunit Sss1